MRGRNGGTVSGDRGTNGRGDQPGRERDRRYQVAALDQTPHRFVTEGHRETGYDLPLEVVPDGKDSLQAARFDRETSLEFPKPVVHRRHLGRAVVSMLGDEPSGTAPSAAQAAARRPFFFGPSRQLQQLQEVAARIAASDAPVLIQGEVGTGKETLARHLHARSPRSAAAFGAMHCTAHAAGLSEIELFGCQAGAAESVEAHPGLLELSHGGSVLLADVTQADLRLQARLLRFMQDGEFQRAGGREAIRADVRVFASAYGSLEQDVADGRFLIGLYYALEVIRVRIPALRERREDILPLAEVLLERHAGEAAPLPEITPALRAALQEHDWPGNVRELENVMRRLLVLRAPDTLARELRDGCCAPADGAGAAGHPVQLAVPPGAAPQAGTLEEVIRAKEQAEREVILGTLDATRWNRKQAAAMLKSDYKAFLYKMKKLKIETERAAPGRVLVTRASENPRSDPLPIRLVTS